MVLLYFALLLHIYWKPYIYNTDKNTEYLKSTMEKLVFGSLICWIWVGLATTKMYYDLKATLMCSVMELKIHQGIYRNVSLLILRIKFPWTSRVYITISWIYGNFVYSIIRYRHYAKIFDDQRIKWALIQNGRQLWLKVQYFVMRCHNENLSRLCKSCLLYILLCNFKFVRCKLHFSYITLYVRITLKSWYLFVFGVNRKCQDYVYIKWEYWSTMYKIKHYLRYENKVNENKVSYCKAWRCETNKKQQKSCFPLCQTYKPAVIFN